MIRRGCLPTGEEDRLSRSMKLTTKTHVVTCLWLVEISPLTIESDLWKEIWRHIKANANHTLCCMESNIFTCLKLGAKSGLRNRLRKQFKKKENSQRKEREIPGLLPAFPGGSKLLGLPELWPSILENRMVSGLLPSLKGFYRGSVETL